jgi:hypothetical protein
VAEEVRRFSELPDVPGARAEVVVQEGHPASEIVRQAERPALFWFTRFMSSQR